MAQCRYCGSPVSDNNPSQDCGRHNRNPKPRHLTMGITPRGSAYLRKGPEQMPGTLPRKLKMEKQPPQQSAGVYGFPYFTMQDRDNLERYLQTGDARYRPPGEIVMDRFPIATREVKGFEIPQNAVGIFDRGSNFWYLAGYAPENNETSDATVLITEDGERFMAFHNREYQIVELDLTYRQQR